MGRGSNNAHARLKRLSMLVMWSMEIYIQSETDFKNRDEGKKPLPSNQVKQSYCQHLGQERFLSLLLLLRLKPAPE